MNSLWNTSQSSAVNDPKDSCRPIVATRSETPLRAAEFALEDVAIAIYHKNSDVHLKKITLSFNFVKNNLYHMQHFCQNHSVLPEPSRNQADTSHVKDSLKNCPKN